MGFGHQAAEQGMRTVIDKAFACLDGRLHVWTRALLLLVRQETYQFRAWLSEQWQCRKENKRPFFLAGPLVMGHPTPPGAHPAPTPPGAHPAPTPPGAHPSPTPPGGEHHLVPPTNFSPPWCHP